MYSELPFEWKEMLAGVINDKQFQQLVYKVQALRQTSVVYPPASEQYTAFHLTKPEDIRVVILGQDPYHEPGQAHGLAFSVKKGVKIPPSLKNIYTERNNDLGIPPTEHGNLSKWAENGVFLLNTVLTVEQGKANSHKGLGWQWFTDETVKHISALPQPIAFILWGTQAWKKEPLTQSDHPRLIIKSPHPSPLSAYRGFFGSSPFSMVNDFLVSYGESPIDWNN